MSDKEIIAQKDAQISLLKAELAQLKKLIYGAKSERFVEGDSPDQLRLDLGLDQLASQAQQVQVQTLTRKTQKPSKSKPTGRHPFPAHLPREVIVIQPEVDTTSMRKIKDQITEVLDYTPARFKVKQYVTPIYADPEAETLHYGVVPGRPISKGMATAAVLAHILVSKYVDHLPLYRQHKIYRREGIELSRSTMAEWVGEIGRLLDPLYEKHRALLLEQNYLLVDETPIGVMDSQKKGKLHKGFHWVYQAPASRMVLFDYRKGRSREGPKELLQNFEGYLQADGYQVYDFFQNSAHITLLGCMAHARRKFNDALVNDKTRAAYAMELIQRLYAIERRAREEGLSHKQIYQLRQKESKPLMDQFHAWLKQNLPEVLPKSTIAKAIAYTLGQWDKLYGYLQAGHLLIDNNEVENKIRPVALGRKNYLFAGSHQGARRAAMIYSFFGTCLQHNIDPQAWLTDVLERIPHHPINQIEELLPHKWVDKP